MGLCPPHCSQHSSSQMLCRAILSGPGCGWTPCCLRIVTGRGLRVSSGLPSGIVIPDFARLDSLDFLPSRPFRASFEASRLFPRILQVSCPSRRIISLTSHALLEIGLEFPALAVLEFCNTPHAVSCTTSPSGSADRPPSHAAGWSLGSQCLGSASFRLLGHTSPSSTAAAAGTGR